MKKSSLNHAFRIIWSAVTQSYVAVSEHTRGRGKSSTRQLLSISSLFLAPALLGANLSFADQTGGQVVSGSGSIVQTSKVTTINQTSQKLGLNWKTFNINSDQTVNFAQPNSTALAVNHIFDNNGSRIMGHLNANGQVWLINPNGVYFGQGAQVNVGALLASTLNPLNVSNTDNNTDADTLTFGGSGKGIIINQGSIHAADGGYVALMGKTVSNQGVITAKQGTVALAAGSQVSLSFGDNQLLNINVDQSILNNLAENKQLIQADGGLVYMTAGAKESLLANTVNNTGVIEAKTVQHKDGKIVLMGGMKAGTTHVAGTLDASAQTGNGGFIETSAANVKVANDAVVNTKAENTDGGTGMSGTYLIDPVDFTVAASGGDMTGAAVANMLNNNNQFTIQSGIGSQGVNGDININDAISWGNNSTLTLNAYRNININQSITANNANGKLALQYGQGSANAGNTATYNVRAPINLQAGQNFSTKLGNNGSTINYKVITSLGSEGSNSGTDLQGIKGNLSDNYVLGANIDASSTSGWNGGAGFTPIGDNSTNTNGGAYGDNSTSDASRFTGILDGLGHSINNMTINLPNTEFVGFIGFTNKNSTIQNIGILGGSFTGGRDVGSLVGANHGAINNSYSTANVVGSNSYSDNAKWYIGGLAGVNNGGTITNSYASGSVTASSSNYVGGLVGISGNNDPAGQNGLIKNCYASGNVNGNDYVGGFIGINYTVLQNSYAKGFMSGNGHTSGFVGDNSFGSVSNSFWNIQTSGRNTASGTGSTSGITGKTTGEMQTLNTFTSAGWNIDSTYNSGTVWRIYAGQTSPLLRGLLTPLDLGTTTRVYNGASQTINFPSGTNVNLISGNFATGTNFGSYSSNNLYSTQQGYDLTGGNLIINQASISILNVSGSRVYDGTTIFNANVLNLNGLIGNETLTLSGTGSVADKNVGTGKTLDVTNLVLGNGTGSASNYTFTNGAHTVDITPRTLTASATATSKVYDGTTSASIKNVRISGILQGDSVSVNSANATGSFDSKHVGVGKSVSINGVTLSGTDAANYVVDATNATANITAKTITVTATASSKEYNGTSSATASINSTGLIANDDVDLVAGSANFVNKKAGSNKVVTISGIGLTGADAGDYFVKNTTAKTKANISKKALSVTVAADDKIYNGKTTASLNQLAVSGLITDDVLTVKKSSATFDNKNVGAGKTVTVKGITLTGKDAANYAVVKTATTTASITPKNINATAVAKSKVFDGTTTATLSKINKTGVMSGDKIVLTNTAANFDTSDVGTGKAVTVSGITLTGKDAGNYTVNDTTTTTANITAPKK